MDVQNYQDLIAWQKAMTMVTEIYELTKQFPSDERFGLTAQIRRAAVSIPSNIAEGHARNSTGEFIQFLGIARGSLAEVNTQLLIAKNLRYVESIEMQLDAAAEVGRILNGLMKSLKK